MAGSGQAAGSRLSAGEDRLGAFIEQNQGAWNQRQARYDQMVDAFSSPAAYGRENDALLVAGPGYSGGMGSGMSDREAHLARVLSQSREPEAMGFVTPLGAAPSAVVDMAPTRANALRLGLMGPDGQTDSAWSSSVTQSNVVGVPLPLLGSSVMGPSMSELDGMSYGEQMRNVGKFFGDLGIGAVKGLDNLIPETAAFAYRMTGYAAAGVVSLVNTDASDRMFAQYERVTGRLFDYDNGVQEFGGVAAQLAAPTIFKGISAGGSRLYQLEQDAKKTINYDYRQYFNGTTTLDADTTFYSYKNSNYLTPGATFPTKELWLTPDLMTSQQAVQKLALPYATGYDTLLTVNLPAGTQIMTPRSVWSLFGRPGGGVETRVYAPVTSDMYRVSPTPK